MAIYLDNAATTPLRKEVKDCMMSLLEGPFGNPSSTHQFGRKSRALVEDARRYIAKSLHCTPHEIIFTSGGTEADNMALTVSVRDLGVKRIITSPIEHPAVLRTAEALAEKDGIQLDLVRIDERGAIDLDHLEELLKNTHTTLVSLMHGNNEVGNLLDIVQVGKLVKSYGAYFHSDTVQTVGHFNLHLDELPVDFIAASAHKFYGPKGVGFLYIRNTVKVGPVLYGGGQERGMRSGTENGFSIAAMHTALKACHDNLVSESAYIKELKKYLKSSLQANFPSLEFNGHSGEMDKSLYTVLNVGFPDMLNDSLFLFNLDMRGLAVSGGSACASGSQKPSHVIEALGNPNYPVVRFSLSKNNTREEIDQVIKILKEVSGKD